MSKRSTLLATVGALALASAQAAGSVISQENVIPGTPPSAWDIPDSGGGDYKYGDAALQGFSNYISYAPGDTVNFLVSALNYHMDIYRIGYYQGNGARYVDTVAPSAPVAQPPCVVNANFGGAVDCSNWSVTATWQVPSSAVSGLYVAHIVRNDDTGPGSHILFIVRDDSNPSDILFVLSTATWQAYNAWGFNGPNTGASLYYGGGAEGDQSTRAYAVSYDRPFDDRARNGSYGSITYPFGDGEYQVIRWLEANGYDVTYAPDEALDQWGANYLSQHKVVLVAGHHEYVSANERAALEGARDTGVNLVALSGNETFWETYYSGRYLVCYKTTLDGATDGQQWTGTWRDSSAPGGGYPENALWGPLYMMDNDGTQRDVQVPPPYSAAPEWSGSGLQAAGGGSLPALYGYEGDWVVDNGWLPAGLRMLSSTPISSNAVLQDAGGTYGPGQGTHAITSYAAPSGARVVAFGSVDVGYGLDPTGDVAGFQASPDLRDLVANVLAEMGAVPSP